MTKRSKTRHERHSYLYFHVFSTETPDEFYPDCESEIVISKEFLDKTSEEHKGFKLAINSQYGNLGNGIHSVYENTMNSKVSYHFPDAGEQKLKAWEFLSMWTPFPEKYRYHGMFIKADNFGRYYFKFVDSEVEKVFTVKKANKKFGL